MRVLVADVDELHMSRDDEILLSSIIWARAVANSHGASGCPRQNWYAKWPAATRMGIFRITRAQHVPTARTQQRGPLATALAFEDLLRLDMLWATCRRAEPLAASAGPRAAVPAGTEEAPGATPVLEREQPGERRRGGSRRALPGACAHWGRGARPGVRRSAARPYCSNNIIRPQAPRWT